MGLAVCVNHITCVVREHYSAIHPLFVSGSSESLAANGGCLYGLTCGSQVVLYDAHARRIVDVTNR